MKNIKLKALYGGGWCLTIEEKPSKFKQLLLTDLEVWALRKVITDRESDILFNIGNSNGEQSKR